MKNKFWFTFVSILFYFAGIIIVLIGFTRYDENIYLMSSYFYAGLYAIGIGENIKIHVTGS